MPNAKLNKNTKSAVIENDNGVSYSSMRLVIDTSNPHSDWEDRRDSAVSLKCCGKDFWHTDSIHVEICTRNATHETGKCGPLVVRQVNTGLPSLKVGPVNSGELGIDVSLVVDL